MPPVNAGVFVLGALVWGLLAALLFFGLVGLIWTVLGEQLIAPDARAEQWAFRFRLAQMLALTTVLGAVVALPITLTRLRLAREENETAKEALFNQKITEAAADLYAQRQVTRRYADGRLRDEWEDDVVRRNAAIDRLEGLVHTERPEEAERVARLLSTYVRELSREHPPKPVPQTEDVGEIRRWARSLRPARSDMENAAQVLGRLAQVNDSEIARRAIDLRGANLQGFDLKGAQLPGARLGRAQLQGAGLLRAQLQGAFLGGAQLQGAGLDGAQLQGAVLGEAHLQGTRLDGAQLQGAFLVGAKLQGAGLFWVEMDDLTSLTAATLRGAGVRDVGEIGIAKLQPFWEEIFADGSVPVPRENRPAHWAREKLDWDDFLDAWHAWQRSIGMDPDDPT
jgi:hypothetical protein